MSFFASAICKAVLFFGSGSMKSKKSGEGIFWRKYADFYLCGFLSISACCVSSPIYAIPIVVTDKVINYTIVYMDADGKNSRSGSSGRFYPDQAFPIVSIHEKTYEIEIRHGDHAFISKSLARCVELEISSFENTVRCPISPNKPEAPVSKDATKDVKYVEQNGLYSPIVDFYKRFENKFPFTSEGIIAALIFVVGLILEKLRRGNETNDTMRALLGEMHVNADISEQYVINLLMAKEGDFGIPDSIESPFGYKFSCVSDVYEKMELNQLRKTKLVETIVQLYANIKIISGYEEEDFLDQSSEGKIKRGQFLLEVVTLLLQIRYTGQLLKDNLSFRRFIVWPRDVYVKPVAFLSNKSAYKQFQIKPISRWALYELAIDGLSWVFEKVGISADHLPDQEGVVVAPVEAARMLKYLRPRKSARWIKRKLIILYSQISELDRQP